MSAALEIDAKSAAKKLAWWTRQGWLRRVRRGLYIPVPLDADPPLSWTEDPLVVANEIWEPCYFTGWTASSHWALTEQSFRTTVLKTTQRVRASNVRLMDYQYLISHATNKDLEWGLTSLWRDQSRLSVADPTRTVLDLLDDPRLGGGIRHCVEIFTAYMNENDPSTLIEYGDRLGNRTVFKRLEYLLELGDLGSESLRNACASRISAGTSPLDPSGSERGRHDSRWRLRINVVIEPTDLLGKFGGVRELLDQSGIEL